MGFHFFSSEKPKNYQFEEGLTVKINIAEKEKIQKLFLHGTKYSPSKFIDVTNNTKEFDISNLYLFENQELNISKLDFRGKLGKPNLDVNFYPSKIPELSIKNFYALPVVESYTFESLTEINNFSKLNNSEVLEGISLTTNLEKVRRTKIKSEAFGRVFFVDKFQKKLSLVNYLNSKPGIFALDDSSKGQLVVINKRTLENLRLVLNGLQVSESLLFNYWMDDVDYIEIETTPPLFSQKTHSGGTVSIKTKGNTFRRRNITISNFEIPLTFTKEKKFYTPKYESYNYAFFRNYGVIDWQPINKINKNGLLQIQLKDIPFKSFKLFIEGITKDGHFISEEKVLKIE